MSRIRSPRRTGRQPGRSRDVYRGLSSASEAEPRLGIAYNIKQSNTVLRISYARTLETPFNENLIISSTGCNVAFIAALIPAYLRALPRDSEMSSMPDSNKLSANTRSSTPSTFGSTRTTRTTSACWATRRSLSQLTGTIRRSLDGCFVPVCRTFMDSARWW